MKNKDEAALRKIESAIDYAIAPPMSRAAAVDFLEEIEASVQIKIGALREEMKKDGRD